MRRRCEPARLQEGGDDGPARSVWSSLAAENKQELRFGGSLLGEAAQKQ